MERTEFNREATRLDREFQYLGERHPVYMCANKHLSLTNAHYTSRSVSPGSSLLIAGSCILRTFVNTIVAFIVQYYFFKYTLFVIK